MRSLRSSRQSSAEPRVGEVADCASHRRSRLSRGSTSAARATEPRSHERSSDVMKVLLAGASGAIGIPLTRQLIAHGHEVLGLTRQSSGAAALSSLGATPVVADALDRDALLRAVDGLSADAIINELTALRRPPTQHSGLALTNRLRIEGTANLLAAAEALGSTRFITQSIIFGYGYRDHGSGPPHRGIAVRTPGRQQVRPARRRDALHRAAGVRRPGGHRTALRAPLRWERRGDASPAGEARRARRRWWSSRLGPPRGRCGRNRGRAGTRAGRAGLQHRR